MKEDMDEPKPFGMWTRKHIAADPRCPYSYDVLAVMLNKKELPPLVPTLRAGGLYLYADGVVEDWFAALARWRAEAPARAAAKKAEQDRRMRAAMERESERMRLDQAIGKGYQDAFDARAAEVERMRKTGDFSA